MPGYQIVELPSLNDIIVCNPENGFAKSILAWLAYQLSAIAKSQDLGIRVDVIMVKYISEYPALGIFYYSEETEDKGQWIVSEGEKLLSNFSLDLFSKFLRQNREPYLLVLNRVEG